MKKTILMAALLLAALQVDAQTGRDIVLRVKNRPDGDTRYAEMQLTLTKKNGNQRDRKMISWAMDEGKDTKKIMFFTFFVIADNGGKINSFDTSENIDVNLRVDFFHFFDKVFNFLTF